jgi:hypothetical protein
MCMRLYGLFLLSLAVDPDESVQPFAEATALLRCPASVSSSNNVSPLSGRRRLTLSGSGHNSGLSGSSPDSVRGGVWLFSEVSNSEFDDAAIPICAEVSCTLELSGVDLGVATLGVGGLRWSSSLFAALRYGLSPGDGLFAGGCRNSGGSDIDPLISEESVCLPFWCLPISLRQQRKKTTPMMKETEIPEATDIPMTAPLLRDSLDTGE